MHSRTRKPNRIQLVLLVVLAAVLLLRSGIGTFGEWEETEDTEQAEVTEATEDYPVMETFSGKQLPYTACLTLEATAYSGGGQTATGTMAGEGTVAVDPEVIPLGSELYIVSEDGSSWAYGYAVAEDTGRAIQGDRIDLFYESESDCQAFGRRMVTVYVLAE